MSIFSSSVEALHCAKEIQESILEHKIPLRIGIHLGDIAIEGEDVYGDGVNIASRVESLGIPGSVLFTKRIFEDIISHPEFEVNSLGQFHFKNDKTSREIYALHIEGYQTPTREKLLKTHQAKLKPARSRPTFFTGVMIVIIITIAGLIIRNLTNHQTGLTPGDIQSLIILPFDNFTGDDDLDYVAAGMHHSLISDIGRISSLRVISQTSATAYKSMNKSLPQIAKEANVEAIIEPNVTCYGDTVCVQVRVMSMYPEEKQLLVADFREEKSQILNLYNNITKQIAEEMMVRLTPEQEQSFAKSRTVDREAYDAFLRSHQYWDDASLESLNKAKEYLNSAIEKDSNWAPLYAGLAKVWIGINQMGFMSPEIAVPKIYKNLNKAIELDPDHADSRYLNALIAYLAEWNWEKGEKEFLKAIAINPNDPYSRIYYAHLLYILQRPLEAAAQAKLAIELDPLNPIILITYSYALLCAEDCKTAMIHAEKALEIDPGNFIANNTLGGVAFRCKNYDKAFETEKLNLQGYSSSTGLFDEEAFNEIEKTFDEQGYFVAYQKILHQYEILFKKGLINPGVMVIFYITGNQQEKAMNCLEKGYEIHDPQMPYIASGGYPFDSLYSNPRFIAILEKMNLPLPRSN